MPPQPGAGRAEAGRIGSWRGRFLSAPAARDLDVEPELVEDALHDEIHQLGHGGGTVIEPWRRRDHDSTRLGHGHQISQVHQRERCFAGDEEQTAALLSKITLSVNTGQVDSNQP